MNPAAPSQLYNSKTAKNVRGLVSMGERGYGLLRTPRAVAMVTFVKG